MSLSDEELAVVVAASARAGLSRGAYLATLAVAQGAEALQPTLVEPAEWMRRFMTVSATAADQWRILRTVGGLLNQVAATGNSTGELPPQTADVMTMVQRVAERVDVTSGELRALVREQRALLG